MFKRFYESGWQHPGLAFMGAVPVVVAWAVRQRFLVAWFALFVLDLLADALFTGALDPVKAPAINTVLGIAFVILGDFRYFLLAEWAIRRRPEHGVSPGVGPGSSWIVAAALAIIVPVTSIPIHQLHPTFATDPAVDNGHFTRIYLLYESMFIVFAIALRISVLPRRLRTIRPDLARWILKLTHFEIAQYALWILCDVWILARGDDAAYLLRALPNTMYYVLFLPFAWWTAPKWLRLGEPADRAALPRAASPEAA